MRDAFAWLRTAQIAIRVLAVLCVAVTLVALGFALVAPPYRRFGPGDRGAAEMQMKSFGDAVDYFHLQRGTLPTSLEQLTEEDPKARQPYMDRIPLDPWRRPYVYRVLDAVTRRFVVLCAGEDGRWGTEDDLSWPPQDER